MPTSSGQPLSSLKVLDFTWHLAGPYGSKLLADYGADVVKVERPGGGDPARRYGPFPGDQPHLERSGLFLHVNTNKRSITLNLADDSAKAIALELARDSDIVIESFAPGVMDAFGLGYEALRAVNPRLVMCSLSSYGQTGPYRDWKATDMTMYALAGSLKTMGVPSREPLRNVDHLTEYQAGNMAAMAVMGAVVQQHWADEGQYIDVSVYEVAAGSADRRLTYALGWQYTGDVSERMETQHMALPAGNFPCADGYLNFMISPPRRWPNLFHMLGHPEYIEDERMKGRLLLGDARGAGAGGRPSLPVAHGAHQGRGGRGGPGAAPARRGDEHPLRDPERPALHRARLLRRGRSCRGGTHPPSGADDVSQRRRLGDAPRRAPPRRAQSRGPLRPPRPLAR